MCFIKLYRSPPWLTFSCCYRSSNQWVAKSFSQKYDLYKCLPELCIVKIENWSRVLKMIVVLSRFTIANNMTDDVRAAFNERPHLVDSVAGFLGMEVMSPVGNPAEIWLVTRWIDQLSYHTWHQGHAYHASHQAIPKGLKLVPGSTEIQLFEVFAD